MHDSCAYQLCGALDHLVPLQVLQVQGARALDGDLCSNFMFLLFGDNDDHGGEDRDNDDHGENADDDGENADDYDTAM